MGILEKVNQLQAQPLVHFCVALFLALAYDELEARPSCALLFFSMMTTG